MSPRCSDGGLALGPKGGDWSGSGELFSGHFLGYLNEDDTALRLHLDSFSGK